MPRKLSPPLALFIPLPLYGAVIAGLYLFQSGWIAIVGYHLAMLSVLGLSGGLGSADQLGKGWRAGVGTAMTTLCLLSGGALYLLFPFIARDGLELGSVLEGLGLSGWSWIAFIAYYSLVNPWIEELFWRGWYSNRLDRPFLSDLLFAGYHVFVLLLFVGPLWAGLTFLILATTAWIWRALTARARGLLIPVVSHLAADLSVIAAAALLAS